MYETPLRFYHTKRATVKEDRECGGGDALIDPVYPDVAEAKTSENIEKEGQFHGIKGFLCVNLQDHQSFLTLFFFMVSNAW